MAPRKPKNRPKPPVEPVHLMNPAPSSPAHKHFPKYKDFLFDGTVTLYIGPNSKRMEIHKKLLASISPELNKHVNNDMREGIEGIIRLPDEGEEPLTLFTEWAYTGDYTHKEDTLPANTENHIGPEQDPWPDIHTHLQLCAFSHKFNIPILKQLAESKFHAEITPVQPSSARDVAGLVSVIGYGYNNLPNSHPILKFFAQYAAWKLELLRATAEFNNLILAQPDFLKELLMNLDGLTTKPTAPQNHQTQWVPPSFLNPPERPQGPTGGLPRSPHETGWYDSVYPRP